jgi:uncharacterized protein (DUF488 family)
MIETIHTIGGYGYSKESFFKKLKDNKVDILVDIRQRRGMRGKTYSFLNSSALQIELSSQEIAYIHLKELAPTDEVRNAQKEDDKKIGTKKRSRLELSDAFKEEYRLRVLVKSDVDRVLMKIQAYRNPCFFCVEGPAAACHRSLVTDWILDCKRYPINDITAS